MNEVSQLSYG
jgi:hypothetical protein